MIFIKDLKDGQRVSSIYLCKQKNTALTKNGKEYYNVSVQDKTGNIDVKVWEINSPGIRDFEAKDYIEITGRVASFNGALQISAESIRVISPEEIDVKEFFPVSEKDTDDMYSELLNYVNGVKNEYLNKLLKSFFVDDENLKKSFIAHSAAKTVHHSFISGLLQHTITVTKICDYFSSIYPIINRDLLITAAMLHDIGKTKELSEFPENDYTDDGNLLGHIVIGIEMINENIDKIEGFPKILASELKHCVVAHHGELEFGSPKKPSLVEAIALSFADNTDAKIQTISEAFNAKEDKGMQWLGYNKFVDSNIRRTHETWDI